MKIIFAFVVCGAFVTGPLQGQAFTFPDFSSVANLAMNGSAAQVGNELQVTPDLLTQAGSAWHTTAQPVVNGFDTLFTFRITRAATANPADGMCFVIQNDPMGTAALGGTGDHMAYLGMRASVVVEFDTWQNGYYLEASPNTVSIHTNGAGPNHPHEAFSLGSVQPPLVLADGLMHQARIEYVPGTLSVYIDNLSVPLLSVPYDLVTGGTLASGAPVPGLGLATGTAWVGFLGSTGGASEAAHVLSWLWASTPANFLTLTLGQHAGSGSAQVQVINGAPGASYFTTLSVDPLNASNPGQGWWGGLHIPLIDVLTQYSFAGPPFRGTLDGTGSSLFSITGLPLGLPTIYMVTRTFDATTILATSNVASLVIL